MNKQKKNSLNLFSASSLLKRKSLGLQLENKKTNIIRDPNIDELKEFYARTDRMCKEESSNLHKNIENIVDTIDRAQLSFLVDLSKKISLQEYHEVIGSLKLVKKQEGTFLIEKGKKPHFFFILIEGNLSYHIESEGSGELVCVGEAEIGYLIYPEAFMTPKFVSYSIHCDENCCFLAFNEETYTKYIKKTLIKQTDEIVSFLNRTTLFDGLGSLTLRKYLSYFLPKTYKYNEIIYEAGTQATCIQLITEGEVELFSRYNGSSVGLVKLSKGEFFGVQCMENLMRKYEAKSVQGRVKVLCLDLGVLTMVRMENSIVSANYEKFIGRIDQLHHLILTKNIKILNKEIKPKPLRRKKKMRAKKNKNVTDLQWWGLAENLKADQKYRIPNIPNFNETCSKKMKKNQINSPRTLFAHKIGDLRRRVLQNDLEDYEDECMQMESKENVAEGWITTNYAPKMRKKIQMLDTKPKAINMVEVVKKKLLTYAKNMGSFCDRLNLE